MSIKATVILPKKQNDKFQRTLSAPVDFSGRGLFSGMPAEIRIFPAEPDTGILFRRIDLPGKPSVCALVDNIARGERFTTLRSGSASVRVIEHLMAAAAGMEIDNLEIEVDAEELPCLDGSAAPYADAFIRAGIQEQDAPRRIFRLAERIAVESENASIVAEPQEEGLDISYTLDYGERFLRRQSFSIRISPESFAREIAPARTYVLRPEIEYFMSKGLGGGATPDNTVVVEEDGRSPAPLRFPDECVRHKILDLIGDLSLAGAPLAARITAVKSGHDLNARLAERVRKDAAIHPARVGS